MRNRVRYYLALYPRQIIFERHKGALLLAEEKKATGKILFRELGFVGWRLLSQMHVSYDGLKVRGFRSHRVQILLRVLRIASRTYLRLWRRDKWTETKSRLVTTSLYVARALASIARVFKTLIARDHKDAALLDPEKTKSAHIYPLAHVYLYPNVSDSGVFHILFHPSEFVLGFSNVCFSGKYFSQLYTAGKYIWKMVNHWLQNAQVFETSFKLIPAHYKQFG